MAKANTTRETILGEALAQAVVVGLEGLSIGGLAEALGLSKSGLFAHFKSKEALQLAVLEAAIQRFAARVVRPAMAETDGKARLERLFFGYLDWIAGDARVTGCLFITAIQEYDDRPGPLRDRLVASQREWRTLLEETAQHVVGEAEAGRVAFELTGLALAYQHGLKLLGDADVRERAEAGFRRLTGG